MMNDSDAIRNLIQAVLEMIIEQKKQTSEITKLIERIDILSTIVVNSQKQKSIGGILNKENWPQTVFSLIVLALIVLVLIFKGGCTPENPKYFYIDEEIDAGNDFDSGHIDSEIGTDDSESVFDDSETGTDDSNFDSDTFDIVDDTDTNCPWDCLKVAKKAERTCDPDWDTDFGGPSYVRNWNYQCPLNHWCCQPWPDPNGLTKKCDHCGRNCMIPSDIRLDLACDYPFTMCCDGGNNEFSKRNTGFKGNVFLGNN